MKVLSFSKEQLVFGIVLLFVIIAGNYIGYHISSEYIRAKEGAVMQSEVTVNMDIKPSEEMSIQKVRQWYRVLGQKIDFSVLLNAYPREMEKFQKSRPSIVLFFSSLSCQVCVGETFEFIGELSSKENINVVSVCTSPMRVQGVMYKPKGILNSCFVIDTSSEKKLLPSWITISHLKPIVLFADARGVILNAYFLQEKDFDTRRQFIDSIHQLLSSKE